MIGVSAAVKGAKGDCAQMGKSVPAVIKAAGRPRSELRALLSEPAVKAEYKAAIEAGKYPALRKDLSDAQSGSVACTDVFNQVDRVVGEII